mmetsp:Transcript_100915/g.256770  ORF Transcript_100915/g.256770 Transcript_100915/m.256770 type:complete len:228 (+) Transcript_100915:459-1142(+)
MLLFLCITSSSSVGATTLFQRVHIRVVVANSEAPESVHDDRQKYHEEGEHHVALGDHAEPHHSLEAESVHNGAVEDRHETASDAIDDGHCGCDQERVHQVPQLRVNLGAQFAGLGVDACEDLLHHLVESLQVVLELLHGTVRVLGVHGFFARTVLDGAVVVPRHRHAVPKHQGQVAGSDLVRIQEPPADILVAVRHLRLKPDEIVAALASQVRRIGAGDLFQAGTAR